MLSWIQDLLNKTSSVPIGTVISVMGNHAPKGYLICDGTQYNIEDYPELASYFETEFGTVNNFGGDGTTTFKVPDLRGEFLRGTGTNSHASQGSGANVGTHQDATNHIVVGSIGNGGNISTRNVTLSPGNVDGYNGGSGTDHYANMSNGGGTKNSFYTSRPTNTSVLYCIKHSN